MKKGIQRKNKKKKNRNAKTKKEQRVFELLPRVATLINLKGVQVHRRFFDSIGIVKIEKLLIVRNFNKNILVS